MIIRNSIRCLKCDTEIVSESRHDFQRCPCGACFVDGGHSYRRIGGSDYEDTSLYSDAREDES